MRRGSLTLLLAALLVLGVSAAGADAAASAPFKEGHKKITKGPQRWANVVIRYGSYSGKPRLYAGVSIQFKNQKQAKRFNRVRVSYKGYARIYKLRRSGHRLVRTNSHGLALPLKGNYSKLAKPLRGRLVVQLVRKSGKKKRIHAGNLRLGKPVLH